MTQTALETNMQHLDPLQAKACKAESISFALPRPRTCPSLQPDLSLAQRSPILCSMPAPLAAGTHA